MTNDKIFLILSPNGRYFKIYEFVEKYMVWDYLGNLRDSTYKLKFPPVIKSLENGKFILFPQVTKQTWLTTQTSYGNSPFNALEVWEKNETLTRSPLELPISFPGISQSLWIVQL